LSKYLLHLIQLWTEPQKLTLQRLTPMGLGLCGVLVENPPTRRFKKGGEIFAENVWPRLSGRTPACALASF